MKHIATVPAALVKAAMLFQAKQDVRYYLNGVIITPDHIVATDGHTLFISPYESELRPEEAMTVAIKGKIPPKSCNLELLHDKETRIGVIRCVGPTPLSIKVIDPALPPSEWTPTKPWEVTDRQGHQERVLFEKIEGRIADYRRALPTCDLVPTAQIGMNFGYADRVAKACKELGSDFAMCAINLRGPEMPIEIELKSPIYPGAKAIIMPCRL